MFTQIVFFEYAKNILPNAHMEEPKKKLFLSQPFAFQRNDQWNHETYISSQ